MFLVKQVARELQQGSSGAKCWAFKKKEILKDCETRVSIDLESEKVS